MSCPRFVEKVKYNTYEQANAVAVELRVQCDVYYCTECGGYHITKAHSSRRANGLSHRDEKLKRRRRRRFKI